MTFLPSEKTRVPVVIMFLPAVLMPLPVVMTENCILILHLLTITRMEGNTAMNKEAVDASAGHLNSRVEL